MKTIVINNLWSPILGIALAGLLLFSACQKTEFMPQPQGEQVPFVPEATDSVTQLLAGLESAKLFQQAFQKSSIRKQMSELGANTAFTLLVPTDAAMNLAGYTSSVLASMSVSDIDSLVYFHTVSSKIVPEQLELASLPVRSMLMRKDYRVRFFQDMDVWGQRSDYYRYMLYMAQREDNLLVNGKSVGKLTHLPAINGALYLIEDMVNRPKKTVLQALQDDGRFTFFLEVQRRLEYEYAELMVIELEPLFGYLMSHEEFWSMYRNYRNPFDLKWIIAPITSPDYADPNVHFSTVFAPTNDAFKRAGFNSVDDVVAYNVANGNVTFDLNMFEPSGGYPIDTILNFHQDWGRMFAPEDPTWGMLSNNSTVFYSNDLMADFINDYNVNIGGNGGPQYAYQMPLQFTNDNGQVWLKVRQAEQAPIAIVESDINTVQGPIHVLDELLLPKGFKFNKQ